MKKTTGILFFVIGITILFIACSHQENPAACSSDGACLHPEEFQGKYGYVDGAGKIVIPPRFDGADAFSEGLAVVLDSGRFGYIDARGAMAIPAVFRHARAFQGGYATVRLRGRWLNIDRRGQALASP